MPPRARARVSRRRASARPAAPTTPSRPKRTLLAPFFRASGVDGMHAPFLLETLLNPDLTPPERPAVLAHEWAHLAGYAPEDDASFVGLLAALARRSRLAYSAWLALFHDAVGQLPRAISDGCSGGWRPVRGRIGRRSSRACNRAASRSRARAGRPTIATSRRRASAKACRATAAWCSCCSGSGALDWSGDAHQEPERRWPARRRPAETDATRVLIIDPRQPDPARSRRGGRPRARRAGRVSDGDRLRARRACARSRRRSRASFARKDARRPIRVIVHLARADRLERGRSRDTRCRRRRLAARFWPGPLTLILHKQRSRARRGHRRAGDRCRARAGASRCAGAARRRRRVPLPRPAPIASRGRARRGPSMCSPIWTASSIW